MNFHTYSVINTSFNSVNIYTMLMIINTDQEPIQKITLKT